MIKRFQAGTQELLRGACRMLNRISTFEMLEQRLPLDSSLVITELVADNHSGIRDGDGDRSDWLELFNVGDAPVDLNGWYLTDDPDKLDKWRFPATELGSQHYLVVFASGKNRTEPDRPLHTNFRLDADGEYLALVRPDGVTIESDYTSQFPVQYADLSFGLRQGVRSQTVLAAGAHIKYQIPGGDDPLDTSTWTDPAFDDTQWSSGLTGIGYDIRNPADDRIQTNVESEMRRVNSTLRMRIPFHVQDASLVTALRLQIQFDDGYVAYLNGQEIARNRAPSQLDATSRANRSFEVDREVILENVDISEFADLLEEGNNVLAIQGLNVASADSDFLVLPELVAQWPDGVQLSPSGYFDTPSPGKPNGSVNYAGKLTQPQVSVERGFYTEIQHVVVDAETPGSTIAYTTDGSTPSLDNGVQIVAADESVKPAAALNVAQTTVLRVREVRDGYIASDVQTHTYIFVDDVIVQSADGQAPEGWPTGPVLTQKFVYGMDPDVVNDPQFASSMTDALLDIPSISIVTDQGNLFDPATGIYVNAIVGRRNSSAWERPTSIELLDPEGHEQFQTGAGLRIRGGASRASTNPKHSFRLLFRAEYGESKLRYPLFGDEGTDEYDNIDLRTAQARAWNWCLLDSDIEGFSGNICAQNTMVREVFARDTQRDMEQPYTRSRYYHLYLNGQYWGLYQTEERPEASYAETYFGGDAAQYDVIKVEPGSYHVVATDGDLDAWRHVWDMSIEGFDTDEAYQRVQGLNLDGTRNPDYPVLLDMDNLIDYMLVTFYIGNVDGPVTNNTVTNNWFGIRDREGETGYQFFIHDAEWGLGDVEENRLGPWQVGAVFNESNPHWIHQKLWENAEYRLRFADRAHKFFFNGGAGTPEASLARIQQRIDQIDLAIIAESARWGDTVRPEPFTKIDWQKEIDYLTDTYLPQRTDIVIDQLINATLDEVLLPLYPAIGAPRFSQFGGQVPDGFSLEMSAPETIYYTTDGSDPRQGPEDVAWQPLVSPGHDVRYQVPTDESLQANWTQPGFDDSQWTIGTTGLGFKSDVGLPADELSERISSDIVEEMLDVNASVYSRLTFDVDQLDQLQRLRMHMRYDDGFVAYLNGVEIARRNAPDEPTWDSEAIVNKSDLPGAEIDLTKWIDLLNPGTNVLAIHGLNAQVSDTDLLILPELDIGFVVDPNRSPAAQTYTHPIGIDSDTQVRARTFADGQWSALSDAVFYTQPSPLRIDEIMYHPADPSVEERSAGFTDGDDFEFIELVNISADDTIDLEGVSLSGGVEFVFSKRALAPGQRIVVARDAAAFVHRYSASDDLAGEYRHQGRPDKLSNGGESIELRDAFGRLIQSFRYDDAWYPQTDGGGRSLQTIAPNHPDLSRWSQPDGWRPSVEPGGNPGGPGRRIGDANGDGVFDSSDFVAVLQAGRYEQGNAREVTFDHGDWNQDGVFDSSDLVFALAAGHYEAEAAEAHGIVAIVDGLFSRDDAFRRQ